MSAEIRRTVRRYAIDAEEEEALYEAALRRIAWRARRGRKTCARCGEDLPVSAFGVDSSREDGLRIYCRKCRSRSRV